MKKIFMKKSFSVKFPKNEFVYISTEFFVYSYAFTFSRKNVNEKKFVKLPKRYHTWFLQEIVLSFKGKLYEKLAA